MSKDLADLRPAAQAAAEFALADLATQGVPCIVWSTLRTLTEQQALWAQGREPLLVVNGKRSLALLGPLDPSDNLYTVTNCDGMRFKSPHQSGLAVDVVPLEHGPVWPGVADPRWRQIAAAFIVHGFRWGGDWDGDGKTRSEGDTDETFVDYPHYEIKEV